MKIITTITALFAVLMLGSCATRTHLPVSSVAPAADITVAKKLDKNNNYNVTVTAKNLAAVDRIAPQKTTYVVWLVTTTGETKNAGQLNIRNAKTSTLKTVTAFDFDEVFVTAEEKGDVRIPAGIEISRAPIGN